MAYTPVTYNLGDTGSNQFAAGVNSMLSAFGMNQDLSGEIGGFMGQMTTPGFQSALANQESEVKGRQSAYEALSIANRQFSQGGVPLSFNPSTGEETGGASLSMIGRWATIGVGAILLIGGLYLFGSSSMADAISEIGPALKASHQKSLAFYKIRKPGKAVSTT